MNDATSTTPNSLVIGEPWHRQGGAEPLSQAPACRCPQAPLLQLLLLVARRQ